MNGSIQHRPDRSKPWRARYWALDGRQISKSFRRKVDAERWLRDEIANLERGLWVDPTHGRIAWADYSAQLLEGRGHLAARTIETDRRCHERAAAEIGAVRLNRLTPELLRKLMSELTAAGYAARDRRQEDAVGQAHAQPGGPRPAHRRVAGGGRATAEGPPIRDADPRRRDVDELAAALPDRFSSLAVVAAYTGLRWGELAGLQVSDVDMLRRRLTVRCALVEA